MIKKIIEKLKSLSTGTAVHTVLQVLIYINQFIAILGSSSFASSPVYQWISFGVTLVITPLTYWYNNDWTKAAQTSEEIFEMLKDGEITYEEMNKFIEEHKVLDNKDEK